MYFEKSLLNLWPGSGSWSLAEDKKGNYYTASAKKFRTPRPVSLLKEYTTRFNMPLPYFYKILKRFLTVNRYVRTLQLDSVHSLCLCKTGKPQLVNLLEVKLRTCPCMEDPETQFSFPGSAQNSSAKLAYSLTKYSLNSRFG